MSFVRSELWYLILPAMVGIIFYFAYFNHKYTNWISDNWFLSTNYFYKISKLFYFLFVILMLASLFDLRGQEEKVTNNIPDQKTVILLDVSSSMLAEDLRPNRFKKALMLARHFVKTSAGHQISLVLFSDFQKRIVPFTDDVDLLEARLAGFEDLDIRSGGSNLTQALSESVKYFYEDGTKSEIVGNILVFTDSEEHDEGAVVEIPDNISVGIVGVGTTRGGTIPLRDKSGIYRGNKTFKGEDVVSKLNESKLRSYAQKIKNYKYWVASTYSLPTEDILEFFRTKFKEKMSKGEVYIRPVKVHLLIIPGIISFILSFVISRFRQFRTLSIIALLIYGQKIQCADFKNLNEDEKKTAQKIEEKLFDGRVDKAERLKLAELYLRNKEPEKAQKLYSESNLKSDKDNDKDIINYATSLLSAGKRREAFELYSEILNKLKSKKVLNEQDKENLNAIRNNSILSTQNKKQEKEDDKKKNDEEKKNDEDKNGENKDQNQNKEENKNQKQEKQDDSKGNQKNKNDKKQDSDQNKNQEEEKNKDNKKNEQDQKDKEKKNEEKKDEEEQKSQNKDQSLEDKENQIKQQRKMVKVPALLKQLMNNDRSLQKRMFDTTTQQGKSYDKKDW